MKTYVIAECGSSHDRDIGAALELVAAAARAGATAFKAQYWSDSAELAARRNAPGLAQLYARYALPRHWLSALKQMCDEQGIAFMCTAYLPQDVATVAPYVAHFKIASFEARAQDLIDAHLPFLADGRRWVLMSRGMGADHASGFPYYLLHVVKFLLCTSSYPAPAGDLNLRRFHRSSAMDEDVLDGFSDHSDPRDVWTGALAVAAGAEIVEAHLRGHWNDRTNPDFAHSMTPEQFRTYVDHIGYAETVLGDGRTQAQPSEQPMLRHRVGQARTP